MKVTGMLEFESSVICNLSFIHDSCVHVVGPLCQLSSHYHLSQKQTPSLALIGQIMTCSKHSSSQFRYVKYVAICMWRMW